MTRLLLLGVLMAADVSSQLDAMWKSLEPRSERPVSWSVHLTPALPAEWTPKSNDAPVVRYAFASGFDPSLSDGARTTPPFAKLEIAPDGTTRVTKLAPLGAVEVQGMKPISASEAELISADLIEPARKGQMSSMRVQWCTWKKYNGVVAQHLAAKHPAFFGALACATIKGGGK